MSSSIKDFVRDTLLQIVEGVDEARERSKITIAPSFVDGILQNEGSQVRFDLAITTSREADGGIKVLNLADLGGSVRSESLNRVQFEVPVWFQGQKIKKG